MRIGEYNTIIADIVQNQRPHLEAPIKFANGELASLIRTNPFNQWQSTIENCIRKVYKKLTDSEVKAAAEIVFGDICEYVVENREEAVRHYKTALHYFELEGVTYEDMMRATYPE